MLQLYKDALVLMQGVLQIFQQQVPPPKLMGEDGKLVYRCQEKTIQQALVLKLAHIQSMLNGALTLTREAHFAAQAALQRIIDEANEDVAFLADAVAKGKITELHERYLNAFWTEEFQDYVDAEAPSPKREMVPRKKIRGYITDANLGIENPSRAVFASAKLSKAYSGFVHGAAPHILDCYDGRRFRTTGMLNTPREKEGKVDFWNYVYRSLLSHILVALALGLTDVERMLNEAKQRLETNKPTM